MILAGSHVTRHRARRRRAEDRDRWSCGCELAPNRAQTILDRNERVDDIRIELALSLVEDLRPGGAPAHRAPVWAVAGHGVERVSHREDACAKRYLASREPVRISAPVPTFVM